MVAACACHAMNDVGEPCAGEPHARFDRGPLARRLTTPDGRRSASPAPTTPTSHQPSGLPHRYWSPSQQNIDLVHQYETAGPKLLKVVAVSSGCTGTDQQDSTKTLSIDVR